MINADTKRHIDSARQVLVGVVPNPTSQIDQITNALIYKFMDDMDQSAIKAGGDPSFFFGDLEPYAWTKIMNERLGHQERMNLYDEALVKFSQAKQLPPLFRDIFKSAYLPYRSPETLGLFLKEISYFDYAHPEDLGDAYEYLLSIMSSQGDAGQFRTPRNIIDFMVDVVNPTKDDKVLDPACGTGGFLVSSYKHIIEQHDGKDDPDHKEKPLTPEQRKKLFTNFEGYDIDPSMVRIAQVNMYLHQFKNPQVSQYDTLTQEEHWGEKYDVILANPPFMSPQGGIRPHNKFSLPSNRSEVLFVDYIMNHLKPKGRAGIIVPEGIIFKSDTATKALRKALVEDGLYAVVSLPAGVFNPYAGVKTSILLFDNEHAKQSDELLFVKVENDGFDLGAQRRPISKNDLPEALKILNAWREGEKVESPIAQWVLRKTIAETIDYNLSAAKYFEAVDYSNTKWPTIDLDEVSVLIQRGKSPKYGEGGPQIIKSGQARGYFSFDSTQKFYVANDFEIDHRKLQKGDLLINSTGVGTAGRVTLFELEGDYLVDSHITIVRLDNTKVLPKFVLYNLANFYGFKAIEAMAKGNGGQIELSLATIKALKIPLPPLEVQQQIVLELDGYQKIIDGARQIVDNWKPKVEIDHAWELKKLESLLVRISDQIDPQKHKGDVFYVGLENIDSGTGLITGNLMTPCDVIKSLKNAFKAGDILYGKLRPNLNKVWLADRDGICSTDILVFRGTDSTIARFFWYLMLSERFLQQAMSGIKGANLPRVGYEHIKEILMPAPPIKEQQLIIDRVEAERAHVESARTLIDLYTQKTQSSIAKLWSE